MSSPNQERFSACSESVGSHLTSHAQKIVSELRSNYEILKVLQEAVSQFNADDFVSHIQQNHDSFIYSLRRLKVYMIYLTL